MLKRRRIYISFIHIPKNRDRKNIEGRLSQIRFNSKDWVRLVKITGILLFVFTNPVFANSGGVAAIGKKAYSILLDVSAWYAIIGCALDLLKCGFNGNVNNVGKVVLNYMMIYASIAMLPWLVDVIKGVLK